MQVNPNDSEKQIMEDHCNMSITNVVKSAVNRRRSMRIHFEFTFVD